MCVRAARASSGLIEHLEKLVDGERPAGTSEDVVAGLSDRVPCDLDRCIVRGDEVAIGGRTVIVQTSVSARQLAGHFGSVRLQELSAMLKTALAAEELLTRLVETLQTIGKGILVSGACHRVFHSFHTSYQNP
jgi:hypothetical protein